MGGGGGGFKINQGLEIFLKFNKRGGQNKWGGGWLEFQKIH